MGVYKNNNGTLIPIAGRVKAEYGASTVRKGTITLTTSSAVGASSVGNVTFAEPMPDTDYLIELETASSMAGISMHIEADKTTKNGFGFRVVTISESGTGQSLTVKYTAYKLYTDTEYNNLLNQQIKSAKINNSTVNTNGYLAQTIPMTTNVIGVVCQDAGKTARLVVGDAGGVYAVQIFKGTGDTVVTSGTASVIYYYI